MVVTVSANGLTISHKGSGGFEQCSAPDVCKTPVGPNMVPIPYMIVSMSADLSMGTVTVKADGGNSVAVSGSIHSRCMGDEAGVGGGVISGVNMKESSWITYSPNVYAEGKSICRLTDKMFMNHKNTVAGAGGHFEVPLGMTDPIMIELCKVFCEAREEWHKCKAKGGKCTKPSKLAQDKVDAKLDNKTSKLSKAIDSKFPKGFGAAEKTIYAAADDTFKGARKIYDRAGLKRALDRKVKQLVKRKIVKKGVEMSARAWTKFVPGLNVLTTIYDVVDTVYTATQIYDAIKKSTEVLEKAIKIKPDFSVHDADGAVKDIYDFKFDDPNTGYQDDWQKAQKQEEAYKKAAGKPPKKVDNATCKCDRKKGPKPAMM